MTYTLLATMMVAFVFALAIEVVRPTQSQKRSCLQRFVDDLRRGFREGYRGEVPRVPLPTLAA